MIDSIHQLLPFLSYGDATSAQVMEIRNYLRRKGFKSEIFAQDLEKRMELEANRLDAKRPEPGSVLIYHHAIGSDLVKILKKHEGIKGIIYHNITPSIYFRKYNPVLARLTDLGREQLHVLKDLVHFAYGVSDYNCNELKSAGFCDPEILPIIVDPKKWDIPSEPTIHEKYHQGNRQNILFVGRISPNKCQVELVQMQFYLKQVMPGSRLLLVGKYDENDRYYQEIRREIYRLGLEDDVALSGHVSMEELKSYYEVSDLFLSFSEHEGFGVPLIEAMWFDLPVLAYNSSAVPETLGEAAFMFTDKSNLAKVAALVKIILTESSFREALVDAQRKRRNMFVPERIKPVLENMLERIDLLEEEEYGHKKGPVEKAPRVAFVVQRYGNEINGGAEFHCKEIAERMTKYWNLDVITTCARDYLTWENSFEPGITIDKKVKIRRFEVDQPRDLDEFSHLTDLIRSKVLENTTPEEQEEWMKAQGPISSDLFSYIRKNRNKYDFFVFFTYLYASTYFCLKEAEDRICLVPTAHDEWPIYLPVFEKVFSTPSIFIFNTPEEKNFLEKRFPNLELPGTITGVGIEKPDNINPERFRNIFDMNDPFILYLGRIDISKGCEILFEHFRRFKSENPSDLKLVLAGKAAMQVPDDPDIVQLGFVDEETKWDALSACSILVNPSLYESLSIVLLEAWSAGKPVLVNEKCEVLRNQTERADGGRSFSDYESFSSSLLYLLNTKPCMDKARAFVEENYNWQKIEDDYLSIADHFLGKKR